MTETIAPRSAELPGTFLTPPHAPRMIWADATGMHLGFYASARELLDGSVEMEKALLVHSMCPADALILAGHLQRVAVHMLTHGVEFLFIPGAPVPLPKEAHYLDWGVELPVSPEKPPDEVTVEGPPVNFDMAWWSKQMGEGGTGAAGQPE